MNLLKGSLFLKFAALLAAVMTYWYIHNEITLTEKKPLDPSYRLIPLTTKKLPVNVRLATSPPEGYRVLVDQVTSQPSEIIVVGPEARLKEAQSVETALVDVSENTKTFSTRVPLEAVAGIPVGDELFTVEVTVPIEPLGDASGS